MTPPELINPYTFFRIHKLTYFCKCYGEGNVGQCGVLAIIVIEREIDGPL